MAWQAIITQIINDPDANVIRVVFTDNISKKIEKEFRETNFRLEDFKAKLRAVIDGFSSGDVKVDLPIGTIDLSVPDPSPEQVARNLYGFNLGLVRQYKRAIDAGVTDQSNQAYVDAQAYVAKNFAPEYIDLF